jgi:type IV secretory pathway TrbL component
VTVATGVLAATLATAALSATALSASAQGPTGLSSVAQGAMSNIEEPRQAIVRTAAEWQALWKQHASEGTPPTVDFNQSTVVAVFLGSRPTTGFAVEITAAKTEGTRTVVEYLERQPPRDAIVAEVLTSPFHIVRLPRTAGAVEFRRLGR